MQQALPHGLDKANVCVLICLDSACWPTLAVWTCTCNYLHSWNIILCSRNIISAGGLQSMQAEYNQCSWNMTAGTMTAVILFQKNSCSTVPQHRYKLHLVSTQLLVYLHCLKAIVECLQQFSPKALVYSLCVYKLLAAVGACDWQQWT